MNLTHDLHLLPRLRTQEFTPPSFLVYGKIFHYGLDGPEIELKLGVRFPAPVHTGSGTHTVTFLSVPGFFSGGKEADA